MPIEKYGLRFPDDANPLTIELYAFAQRRSVEKGGLGTYKHFKNISSVFWPKMIWHDWKRDRIETFCNNHFNHWTGSAASGKTFDAGHLAMTFWAADPSNTAVILTSTSAKMVRKRIWPVIQELYQSCPGFPGNMVDSKTMLQSRKGDDKHGIFALAVGEGAPAKAAAKIQGIHAKRMLIIIDEATDTPEAIFDVLPNLTIGCEDFNVITIGNANSMMDAHGLCCEPKKGWKSITVEDEEWETNSIPKWAIGEGVCLHFDGSKSPNIKLGEDKYPFLMTIKKLAAMSVGVDYDQTLGYWKYVRGFWPPDGICRTVISESMIVKFDGRGKHIFISHKTTCAFTDWAYGGDRCVFYPFELGDIAGDKLGIQLLDPIELIVKAQSKEPVHFQLAHQAIDHCKRLNILPQQFAGDSTSEGEGPMGIMSEEFGPVVRVEFGGLPSELPVSASNPKTCRDAYDRKVTELHYSVREFLQSGQLKGLKRNEIVELCTREYEDKKGKIKLDTKEDCKKKIGRSPDYADSVAGCVELAKRFGATAGGIKVMSSKNWLAKAQELTDVFETEEYEESFNSEYLVESL
jgi:hypothetical protein